MKKFAYFFIVCIIALPLYAQNYKVQDPSPLIQEQGKFYMNAKYSPDGSKIAFTSNNYKGLYVKDLASGLVSEISPEDAAGYNYIWSSDSKHILSRVAFYEKSNRLNAVKLFDLNSKAALDLTGFRSLMPGMPQFAYGDNKIILCSRGILEVFESGIKIDNKDGLSENTLFIKNDKLTLGNILSKTDVKTIPVNNESRIINLVFSKDGKKAAFEVVGGDMFVINSDGNNLVDLGEGNRPAFSNDGSKIVYQITKDNGHEYLSSFIYIINCDGTGKQKLTDRTDMLAMSPSFGKDDNTIIFSSMNDGIIYQFNISK